MRLMRLSGQCAGSFSLERAFGAARFVRQPIPASLKMQLRRFPLTQQVTDQTATPGVAVWFAEQITSR
jgi:hypothetical protein